MSQVSWKEHFTQEISGYDALEAQGLSELGFALRHRQIPEEQYLNWARDTYEAASVEIQFFETHPAPKELFQKWKDSYAWGPECLPIGEWDDHLIVACLEKPADIPSELKPIILIAPIQGLLKYWNEYLSDDDKKISTEDGEKEGGGAQDLLAIDMNVTVSPTLSFTGITLGHPGEAPAAPQPEKKAEVNATPQVLSEADRAIALKISEDTKTNHQNPLAQLAQTQRATPVAPPLQPKAPPPLKAPEIKVESPTMIVAVQDSILDSKTKTEIKAEPQILENTINHKNVNTEAQQPTLTEVIANTPEVPDLELKQVFSEVKKHYDKQLYVEFNMANKTVQAKSWPSDFVATMSPSAYSYEQDSLFSIVFKTQKPYHGYLVANPLAEKFFKEVNSGQVPENVTLVPVMKDNQLVGAFMGWGPKTTYTMTVLKDMEKSVRAMTEKLGWTHKEAA